MLSGETPEYTDDFPIWSKPVAIALTCTSTQFWKFVMPRGVKDFAYRETQSAQGNS